MIKAQVHAGGRGKAGGVKLVSSEAEIREFSDRLIGTNLVTFQTDEKGQPVSKYMLKPVQISSGELYLGAVIDRSTRRITFIASTEGGVEIEKVAEETPEKILQATVDPMTGASPYHGVGI